jgi:hypothetical protein
MLPSLLHRLLQSFCSSENMSEVVHILLLLVTPPHGCRAQPHFCYTCSSPKHIASSISILYKNRGFPFRLSTLEFIPERKPLDDRLARKHSSESPTRFVIPAKPQRVSDRERSCRACGAVPVCSDHNLRCERYSDITVLSILTPLESERMLLLPRIQKGLMPSSIRTML